ncbi:LOW QUALITY PROTEIN: hypothetical protein KUF71_004085 [Frankliniella fusca]|uniref:Uncharacterized protein n=1 Tax=Frankliniella fusca TaxID=407009 RepID=A0AAE1GVQ0_9NEOP|nr:LOW QUALITY PROTEIN: hypothetical protein KUF71_004085 [Frankliniella fusca]
MAFMYSASVEALPTQRSLWLSNATQLEEDSCRCRWIVLSPLANFDSATTIELEAPSVGYAYLDPAGMLLYIKQNIVNAVGSDIKAADNSDATLVNCDLHAQFFQIDANINGTVISQSSVTYPWRTHIEAFLNYDKAAKDTHLQQRMWHEDTAGHHDSLDSNQNLGLAWRRSRTKLSRKFEMMGPLHLDICNTDRLLLNNCTLRIKLIRSHDAFALMSTKSTEKIKLLDVKLYVRRVNILPLFCLLVLKFWKNHLQNILVDIKTVTIAQGMLSETIDNLFINQLPQRVIIGFVDNRAYNGDYTRNLYNFQHFHLNYLLLHVDGQAVPSHPLTPDFSEDLYMECYNTLFSGTGIDEGNGMSWSDYPKENTLFVFDLSPDLSASEPHWNLQRQITIRLDLRFAEPLAQPINCVVYAEFQNLIEIDNDRNVMVDYSV